MLQVITRPQLGSLPNPKAGCYIAGVSFPTSEIPIAIQQEGRRQPALVHLGSGLIPQLLGIGHTRFRSALPKSSGAERKSWLVSTMGGIFLSLPAAGAECGKVLSPHHCCASLESSTLLKVRQLRVPRLHGRFRGAVPHRDSCLSSAPASEWGLPAEGVRQGHNGRGPASRRRAQTLTNTLSLFPNLLWAGVPSVLPS